MSSYLLSPLLIFSFAVSVIAEDISSATHFEASEMQRAGEQLQRRTVDLTANQRKLLMVDLATREASEHESQKAIGSRLAAENER
ncbi:MAG: hypothetical protein KDA78_21790, partial [Planctomycetaceae bacterium]|nr:hypothetical protein [Planctomycetaceae bacterium]